MALFRWHLYHCLSSSTAMVQCCDCSDMTITNEAAIVASIQLHLGVNNERGEDFVGLAQLLAEGRQPGLPPAAEETKAWQEIERTLRAGKLFDSPPEPSTASSTAPSAEPSPGPSQMSGGPGPGRVTVRLRLDDELVGFWRRMEDMHRRSRQGGAFAEWLIGVFLRTWATVKPKSVKYGEIYERDRGQCANPCCTRTDVTPHHIVFRSAGGGEEESNLISLCVVCHLDLLHGGKLEVTGPAGEARFVMGRDRVVVVEGRERAA